MLHCIVGIEKLIGKQYRFDIKQIAELLFGGARAMMTRQIMTTNGMVKANKSGNTPQKPVQPGCIIFALPVLARRPFTPLAPALAHNV
jgi:hypothetical protein